MIAGGADVSAIAAATSRAAESSLAAYADDPVVRRAFYLLSKIPVAARQPDFKAALDRLGIHVERTDLTHVAAALMDDLDNRSLARRSDLGEMVASCAVESLQAVARRELDDLFGSDVGSVERSQEVLAGLATVKQFGVLAQDFFGRLLHRHLSYYLSRELPRHVGIGNRFTSMREHDDFDRALELHCREVARSVYRFAGEWHSKNDFVGGITEKKAGGFVFEALTNKLRSELEARRESAYA